MLRLEKATLGKFGAQDMLRLITSQGWEAILPDALDDNHLLLMSDQLRDLLSGSDWSGDHDPASAALPLALLLLTKAGAKRSGDSLEVGLETLQEALCLLSTAVDREIVNCFAQELVRAAQLWLFLHGPYGRDPDRTGFIDFEQPFL